MGTRIIYYLIPLTLTKFILPQASAKSWGDVYNVK